MEFDVPYLDPVKTHEDYFASTAQGTVRDMNKKDNMKNMYKGASINCDACDMEVAECQTHVMS